MRNDLRQIWLGIGFVLLAISCTSFAAKTRRAGLAEDGTARERILAVERGLEPLVLSGHKRPSSLDVPTLMRLSKDPGLSVAVIDHFSIVWAKAYGSTDSSGMTPVTTSTLFQAGSISKPVATAGMLSMVQQGVLSLDEDVNTKLRSWKVPENSFTRTEKVTLRRLASHTAGLTVHGFPGYDVDVKLPSLVQILDGRSPANTRAIRVDFVPGSMARYSGGGVLVEQQVMIDVSGEAFPRLIKRLVLEKIGMENSSFLQPLPRKWATRAATGTYANGESVHGQWRVYPEFAAAGLWTTPTDLAKFAIEIAQARNGKSHELISQASALDMLTDQPGTDKKGGLGFFLSAKSPGYFEHSGANQGFQALLEMDADTGQGAVVMANSDNGMLVGLEYIHSIAKEYAWRVMPADRPVSRRLILIAKLQGVDRALSEYEAYSHSNEFVGQLNERVLEMLGNSLLKDGHARDAIKVFDKNATEYPQSADAHANLGLAYAASGMSSQAARTFKRTLTIDPDNQVAREYLKDTQNR